MQTNSKLQTYVGFSVRARKVVMGMEAVTRYKRPMELLLLCRTASDNTIKDAEKIAQARGMKLYRVDSLSALVHKENCKIAGLTDKSLASAVRLELEKLETVGDTN